MKTRALLLALPLVALGLAGCRDNRASVTIHGICNPTSACTFSSKCDTFLAGNPAVDAVRSNGGELFLLIEVENQLIDNSSPQLFRSNTNDAHVDEVIVTYEGISLPKQVVATQQRIPTAGSTVIGFDAIQASVANAAALAAFAPTGIQDMTAVVKLGGYFDDGSRFETGEFPIAIQVCSNCIPLCAAGVACPPGLEGIIPNVCN